MSQIYKLEGKIFVILFIDEFNVYVGGQTPIKHDDCLKILNHYVAVSQIINLKQQQSLINEVTGAWCIGSLSTVYTFFFNIDRIYESKNVEEVLEVSKSYGDELDWE